MPGIINALFAGRSGLSSNGTAISVVGDNIANASTIGYKTARADFADLLAGSQTTGKVVGAGSQVQAVTPIISQGTFEFTDRGLDLGIDGGGYFVVADGSERFYTRAGNFRLDGAGFLVNQDGLAVLGYGADGAGALEPLNMSSVSQEGVGTGNVSVTGNLDAGATAIDPIVDIPDVVAAGANPTSLPSPRTTYAQLGAVADSSTVVKVFDSLGVPHNVTFYFFKSSAGANEWKVRGYVNSEEVDPAGNSFVGEPRLIVGDVWDATSSQMTTTGNNDTATFTFLTSGSRDTPPTAGSYDMTAVVPWNSGASQTDDINFSFGGFTQYSARSSILSISQDGRGVGSVTGVDVSKDGKISARFDNGQLTVIGTLGLANFGNPEGLVRVGSNLLRQTTDSGDPVVGEPGIGKLGSIEAGALEQSTVDIASEFVKLISLQRGFQASSRMITTVNQLLNDVIQLA